MEPTFLIADLIGIEGTQPSAADTLAGKCVRAHVCVCVRQRKLSLKS